MINYLLTRPEQETVISFTKADTDVLVYTSDRSMMKKLDALCEQFPDEYQCHWVDSQILGDGLPMGKKYRFPIKNIRFKKPASEAQKEAARKNIAKINSSL